MIGVSRGARRDHSHQVARDDRISVGATHALPRPLAERVYAARPHVADAAADPELAKATLGLHGIPSIPGSPYAGFRGAGQHLLCGGIDSAFLTVSHRQ
jgi:hypothetical protein